ncbi:MAG: hypothetical protein KBG28_09600 [Kofleriaceae bacterium]|jgi:hypothetical protein|nr:hypothetical protein [Kofleriaceae bacterium]MBP6841395.1 hypothetical protein [Kofleriaceae bacterium]MBP9204206.1 hypothetical protein [Kofleriaceae bacterium]
MSRALVVALTVLVALAGAACGKAPRKQCEEMCRRFAELAFWDGAEREIAAAPEPERAALRSKKQAEFETKLAEGVDFCVSKCRSANNEDDNKCVIAAKTFADARKCTGN